MNNDKWAYRALKSSLALVLMSFFVALAATAPGGRSAVGPLVLGPPILGVAISGMWVASVFMESGRANIVAYGALLIDAITLYLYFRFLFDHGGFH